MGYAEQSDQTQANAPFKRRRLPNDLVNPDGVYSGAARRNAFEDGEFFPGAENGKQIKPNRGRRTSDD